MSTKLKPSEHCGYVKAKQDEPFFALLARDQDAPMVVQMWAFFRMKQIDMGLRPESDRAQVAEAMMIATEMQIWQKAHTASQDHAAMEFDHKGQPMTGQHASDQALASHSELRKLVGDMAWALIDDPMNSEHLLRRAAGLVSDTDFEAFLRPYRDAPAT